MSRVFLVRQPNLDAFIRDTIPELKDAVSNGIRREGPGDNPEMVCDGRSPFELTETGSSWVMRKSSPSNQSVMIVQDPTHGMDYSMALISEKLSKTFNSIFYVNLRMVDSIEIIENINTKKGHPHLNATSLSLTTIDAMNIGFRLSY